MPWTWMLVFAIYGLFFVCALATWWTVLRPLGGIEGADNRNSVGE